MDPTRLMRFDVPEQQVLWSLVNFRHWHGHLSELWHGLVAQNVPDDCIVESVSHDKEKKVFTFVVHSSEFAPVPDGEQPPYIGGCFDGAHVAPCMFDQSAYHKELAERRAKREYATARRHNERLYDLVEQLVDDGECSYDHNGLCQAHSLHERPCPHHAAKEMLVPHRVVEAAIANGAAIN